MCDHFPVNMEFSVRRAAWEGWKLPERQIGDYELVFFLRGQGCISIRGERIEVHAGDLVLFYPGVRHSLWVEDEPYMDLIGVHFELPEGAEMLTLPEKMHPGTGSRIEGLFKEVHEAYLRKAALYKWRQNVLVEQILCEMSALQQQTYTPSEMKCIAGAIDYIHAQTNRNVPLGELLVQAGVQKTQFLQAFRRVTGTTPKQYMLTLRLEQARDLLLETDWSVARVAETCGFEDAFYFSRCFRRHFSLSPREYRKRFV